LLVAAQVAAQVVAAFGQAAAVRAVFCTQQAQFCLMEQRTMLLSAAVGLRRLAEDTQTAIRVTIQFLVLLQQSVAVTVRVFNKLVVPAVLVVALAITRILN
jgi:hypothetical protein